MRVPAVPDGPRAPGRSRSRRRASVTLLLVALMLSNAGPAVGQEAPPPRPLRFVTLNILHGGALSGWTGNDQHLEERLDLVTRHLRNLVPDVVALQEASRGRGRGDVAGRLASRLGMHHTYVAGAFQFFGARWLHAAIARIMNFEEGPAILSRFPIARFEEHALPRCGRRFEPRALLLAELTTPWGPLIAASTHTAGDACHTRAVTEIVKSRRGDAPAVVMGDFNAVETSPAIRALTDAGFVDAFRVANRDDLGPTVWQPVRAPDRRARRRVDYVFVLPGGTAVRPASDAGPVLDSRVVVDTPGRLPDGSILWPSDHYGVLAEVAIFPPGQPVPPGDRRASRTDASRQGSP